MIILTFSLPIFSMEDEPSTSAPSGPSFLCNRALPPILMLETIKNQRDNPLNIKGLGKNIVIEPKTAKTVHIPFLLKNVWCPMLEGYLPDIYKADPIEILLPDSQEKIILNLNHVSVSYEDRSWEEAQFARNEKRWGKLL